MAVLVDVEVVVVEVEAVEVEVAAMVRWRWRWRWKCWWRWRWRWWWLQVPWAPCGSTGGGCVATALRFEMVPVTHGSLEGELRQHHREREPQEGGPSQPCPEVPSPYPSAVWEQSWEGPAGGPGGQWEAPPS